MPFRGDSTRYEVDIAEKELIFAALSIYFSNYFDEQEYDSIQENFPITIRFCQIMENFH
jgi:hypothetical protein